MERDRLTRRQFLKLGFLTTGGLLAGNWSYARFFQPAAVLAETAIPPLKSINEALSSADHYLSGLYKPIDDKRSAISEYYACPITVENNTSQQRLLPGKENIVISQVITDKTTESFHLGFSSPAAKNSPDLHVFINWEDNSIAVTNEQFVDSHTSATVYLLDQPLIDFNGGNIGQSKIIRLRSDSNYRLLQSLRYTFRHGTQAEMNRRLKVNNDLATATKLQTFLEESGFAPNFDIHAPIWRSGTEYPDKMLLTPDGNDRYQTFEDCKVKIPPTNTSYMYHSKVCLSPSLYTKISEYDTLLLVAQSLHLLNKHDDPTYRLSGMQTPLDVATEISRKFDQSPAGIGMATPINYNTTTISGLRTAEFCALATDLAYKYGLSQFKNYADATANILLMMQVGRDGWLKTTTGDYYRPAQAGGFAVAWDRSFRIDLEQPFYYQLVNGLNTPPLNIKD